MKKKEKERKKIRTLILLLFLTITMFGTSTYAWFTANRIVTINSINVQVEASNGIQISTNATTWKSVITNADITSGAYTGNVNMLPGTVTAVSTDGTVDQTTGRLNMWKATIGNDASTGAYNIITTPDTETAGSTGNFVAFDVFLRVDENKTIYLTTDSNVTAVGTDKGLKNAARVGFVMLGSDDATADSEDLIDLLEPAATAIIWEPNADAHSDLVTTSVAPEYSVTLGANSTAYYGINQTISTALPLIQVVNPATIPQGQTNPNVATLVTPNIITPETRSSYTQAFTLTAGVTKVRIYMWIEGQDIDCENGATGSNITYYLQLSTDSSAPATSGSGS